MARATTKRKLKSQMENEKNRMYLKEIGCKRVSSENSQVGLYRNFDAQERIQGGGQLKLITPARVHGAHGTTSYKSLPAAPGVLTG
jgi:hypothetical protein